jgi:multimeric flavodoxin WrbA
MQVTTILGSPRREGNTAKVLEWTETLLVQQGHRVDRINVIDHVVNGCLGCQSCKESRHPPSCSQSDDAVSLFRRMIASDAVIYATPLYTYGFPAQMKALIDRQNCLVTDSGGPDDTSLLKGKPSALLVTCGGPVEDNADLIQQVFIREGLYQEWDVVGQYVVPFCTTPDELGDQAMETARQLAGSIVAG